jgi:hypothetical protein
LVAAAEIGILVGLGVLLDALVAVWINPDGLRTSQLSIGASSKLRAAADDEDTPHHAGRCHMCGAGGAL